MGAQVQLVDGDGAFHEAEVSSLVHDRGVAEAGVSYTTVAIMGPQSSGKSTLLNVLDKVDGENVSFLQFGTDFKMMDADEGRRQTTKGIWLDLSPKVTEVPTMVMDLEGSDGRERGEDDTTFERQSALFALATSDILIINMFAVNIGRVQGSGAPLLKTIFQVNLKLFQPAPGKRRTVLLFVIRDRTRTPFEKLCADLRGDLEQVWEATVKPPEYAECSVEDYFEVAYASLPSYEVEPEDFVAEATILRRRFLPSHDSSLVRAEDARVPASALPLHFQKVWGIVSSQKDLDLPAHKVMVANIRCKEIAQDQMAAIKEDQAWTSLMEEAAASEPVTDFRHRAEGLIESCLYGYDQEAAYFVESVRDEVKASMHQELLALLNDAFAAQTAALRTRLLDGFADKLSSAHQAGGERFDAAAERLHDATLEQYSRDVAETLLVRGSGWQDGRAELAEGISAEVERRRGARVAQAEEACLEEMEAAVEGPAWDILDRLPADMWVQLRGVLKSAAKHALKGLYEKLEGYSVSDARVNDIGSSIGKKVSEKMIKMVREHARRVNEQLKAKFVTEFEEENGVQRKWNSDLKEDARRARAHCALLLSRLVLVPAGLGAPGVSDSDLDTAQEAVLAFTSRDVESNDAPSQAGADGQGLLTLAKWDGDVPSAAVLLKPTDAREIWRRFMQDSKAVVRRATELQEERRRANSRPVPLWVYPAILFFGWDELMGLLRSPVMLICSFLLVLFIYQLYQDLEVDKEMEKGLPAAAITISRKFVPASRNLLKNTALSMKHLAESIVSDDSEAQSASAVSSATKPGEVEMTQVHGSPVDGLRVRSQHRPSGSAGHSSSESAKDK